MKIPTRTIGTRRLAAVLTLLTVGGLGTASRAATQETSDTDTSLDEVLSGYYDAVGGQEAWEDLENMKASGTMNMGQGMQAPFTIYSARPDRLRIEFTVQGMQGVQAYDGEEGWWIMPFMGVTEATKMPPDQVTALEREADFDGPLMGFEEEGHRVELVGETEVAGTPAYELEVSLSDGGVRRFYLDREAYLPLRVVGRDSIQGREVESTSILGDYKQVNGVMMAHSIENRSSAMPGPRTITLDSVTFNVELEPGLFSMPAKATADTTGSGS